MSPILGQYATNERVLFSTIRSGGSKRPRSSGPKRARLAKSNTLSLEGSWYTPTATRPTSLDMGRYGLKRLDYKTVAPPAWPLPPHPPNKSMADKIIYPGTLITIAAIAIWAYMNPEEEDMKAYWKRVESGQILIDDDDDDDDDWDDDDEEELKASMAKA
jgi:hypothetical protein